MLAVYNSMVSLQRYHWFCEMKSTLFKSEILDKSQGTADKFVNGVMNASQAKVVILHALDIYSEDR